MKEYNVILEKFEELKENMGKFLDKGVKAAGRRSRKNLLEISKLSKEIRKLIIEKMKS